MNEHHLMIKNRMKRWARDMHKFNEPVPADRLYRLAMQVYYPKLWQDIHLLEDKERPSQEEITRARQAYNKELPPIEKRLLKISLRVIEELEQEGLELD